MDESVAVAKPKGRPLSAVQSMSLLAVVTLVYVPLRILMESLDTASTLYYLAYLYGTGLQVLFAIVILAVAVHIGTRQSVGKQWLLLGLGVTMYAIGDVIWTILELFMGKSPYPSLADVFYVAEYAFFLAAIVLAIRSYRGLVKVGRPTLVALAVAILGLGFVYVLLLRPYIFPGAAELGVLGVIVSTLYPVADVVLMLAPAVALALVVAQLGAGKLARPWWVVVGGALAYALTDSLYSYADWAGTGLTATMDMGWIFANMLFAMASLVALRIYAEQ